MKVYTIGGYDQVGKNMTAIEVDNEIIVLDMGWHMEKVVQMNEEMETMNVPDKIKAGALPNDSMLDDRVNDVKAVVISHGHLDHVGGVPALASRYNNAEIICTPYTHEVLKQVADDKNNNIRNPVTELTAGDTMNATDNVDVEFVEITHSIPGAVLPVLHTPEGQVAYSCDFKLDNNPTLGSRPDYRRMRELGENGNVKVLFADSTRVEYPRKCQSEKLIQIELNHVLSDCFAEGGATFTTCFSSHIARINNILSANNGQRDVIMLGRSMREYTDAAEEHGLIDRSNISVGSYRNEVEDLLSKVSRAPEDYLVICTGGQGEPNAVLSRIARGEEAYTLTEEDHVVFSNSTIPTPVNEANRHKLEQHLKERGTRFYSDVHASGHGMREDVRDLIRMFQPEHVVPAHGDLQKLASCAGLAREEGYELEENVHISQNGRVLTL